MTLKLRIVDKPKLCALTLEQLEDVRRNLTAELGCNVRLSTWQSNPPADTSMPWQPTDACGGTPIGPPKTFSQGEWK